MTATLGGSQPRWRDRRRARPGWPLQAANRGLPRLPADNEPARRDVLPRPAKAESTARPTNQGSAIPQRGTNQRDDRSGLRCHLRAPAQRGGSFDIIATSSDGSFSSFPLRLIETPTTLTALPRRARRTMAGSSCTPSAAHPASRARSKEQTSPPPWQARTTSTSARAVSISGGSSKAGQTGPAGTLPQGFSMKQNLHAKSLPGGTLAAPRSRRSTANERLSRARSSKSRRAWTFKNSFDDVAITITLFVAPPASGLGSQARTARRRHILPPVFKRNVPPVAKTDDMFRLGGEQILAEENARRNNAPLVVASCDHPQTPRSHSESISLSLPR